MIFQPPSYQSPPPQMTPLQIIFFPLEIVFLPTVYDGECYRLSTLPSRIIIPPSLTTSLLQIEQHRPFFPLLRENNPFPFLPVYPLSFFQEVEARISPLLFWWNIVTRISSLNRGSSPRLLPYFPSQLPQPLLLKTPLSFTSPLRGRSFLVFGKFPC